MISVGCSHCDDAGQRGKELRKLQVEAERGITVKAQTVSMFYKWKGKVWLLNLVDTPVRMIVVTMVFVVMLCGDQGHVDFHYEVSRSLAACGGAVLLVDACDGIQAQTLVCPSITKSYFHSHHHPHHYFHRCIFIIFLPASISQHHSIDVFHHPGQLLLVNSPGAGHHSCHQQDRYAERQARSDSSTASTNTQPRP